MTRPGPPPKPVERKRRTGNPGKRALPAPVVRLAASSTPPPPPATLLDSPGREAWDRLWLAASGWLSPSVDYAIMSRLCEAYDLRHGLLLAIGAEGFTVPGSQGQLRPHPLIGCLDVLEDRILKQEASCGFSPAARAQLGLAEVRARNKLEELLQRQRGRALEEDGPA